MLHGREYWRWPDSIFSCYNKTYKQEIILIISWAWMRSKGNEPAWPQLNFSKLKLRLPDVSVTSMRTPYSRKDFPGPGIFSKSGHRLSRGLAFPEHPSSMSHRLHTSTRYLPASSVSLPPLPTEKAVLDHSDTHDGDGKSVGKNKRHCAVQTRNRT